MKFGIFYEHQLPRPWNERSELYPQVFKLAWASKQLPFTG